MAVGIDFYADLFKLEAQHARTYNLHKMEQ
jgi:hypothetical protein